MRTQHIVKAKLLAAAFAIAIGCSCAAASAQDAVDGSGADGRQARAAFTTDWAAELRDLSSFGELQKRVGSAGEITPDPEATVPPHVRYLWIGAAGSGEMIAYVYPGEAFSAIVTPKGSTDAIVVNSFGAFVCPQCQPPIFACGHRPSWIPHDLHWDNFDCAHTLTGPQSAEWERQ